MTHHSWKIEVLIWAKKVGLGIAVVGVLGWLVWVSTIQAVKVRDKEITQEEEFDKTEITEPIAYGYREGALLWRLSGYKAVEVKETQKSTVNRIYEMTFFKEGEPNLYASADAGYWDKSREKLILRGNVNTTSADETTDLHAAEMIWWEKSEIIECPKPIDLTIEDNHITADALYSDKDMSVLEFIGNVKMFVTGLEGESFVTREEVFPLESIEERQKAKKGMTVECEYVFYNKETKYIRCYSKVPRTAIAKHGLDASARPPQYQLNADPMSGSFTWDKVPDTSEEGFDEKLAGIPEGQKGSSEEVTDISKSMGWGELPEAPERLQDTGRDEKAAEAAGEAPKQLNEYGQDIEQSEGVYVPGRVFSHQDKMNKKIWCDFMEIYLDERKIKARGDVRFEAINLQDEDRPAKSKIDTAIRNDYTWVDSDYMNYFWGDEVVDAWGGVHGWQNEKDFSGQDMTYSDVLGLMVLYGDVVVKQYGGEWLKKNDILSDVQDEDAREDVQKPVTIFSNSALSYTESDWSYGWGNVLFEQKEQKIRGKRVEYDDSKEIMVMYENVQFKNEDGEWMLADKLRMNLDTDEYFVEGGQSKARVLIPEEYKDDIDTWEKDREGKSDENAEGPKDDTGADQNVEDGPPLS